MFSVKCPHCEQPVDRGSNPNLAVALTRHIEDVHKVFGISMMLLVTKALA